MAGLPQLPSARSSAAALYPPGKKLHKLGSGTYGEVYKIKLPSNVNVQKEDWKALKRVFCDTNTVGLSSIREISMLTRLKGHPHIVKLSALVPHSNRSVVLADGAFSPPVGHGGQREDSFHMMFECGDYDISKVIMGKDGTTFEYTKMKRYMAHILLAIEYLHSCDGGRDKKSGILHRDLKPQNIIIFDNLPDAEGVMGVAKICDFGMSIADTKTGLRTPAVTTSWYRAPEMCIKSTSCVDYGAGVDIWSAGCIFFEFVCRHAWIQEIDDNKLLLTKIMATLPAKVDSTDYCQTFFTPGVNPAYSAREAYPKGHRLSWDLQLGLTPEQKQTFNSCGPGTFDQFIELLNGMLTFNPRMRWSATKALNSPFFDGYRNMINICRGQYPIPRDITKSTMQIVHCHERVAAMNAAIGVFNDRNGKETKSWYNHRVLFHALEVFDRYLFNAWTVAVRDGRLRDTVTMYHGQLLDLQKVYLYFYVCLYSSIKHFTSLQFPVHIFSVMHPHYRGQDFLLEAQRFEMDLISKHLGLKFYERSVFELVDEMVPRQLTDIDASIMLRAYTHMTADDSKGKSLVAWTNDVVIPLINAVDLGSSSSTRPS